jgi:hypothetical protein
MLHYVVERDCAAASVGLRRAVQHVAEDFDSLAGDGQLTTIEVEVDPLQPDGAVALSDLQDHWP